MVFKVVMTQAIFILSFSQERLINFPEKLSERLRFRFYENFEEINSVVFKADTSKGVVFYLHGMQVL